MRLQELQPGDIVYATKTILNDGTVPGMPENEKIADAGTRGVLINTGHLEENPNRDIYLVRFEDPKGDLGLPMGCWPEEVQADPLG